MYKYIIASVAFFLLLYLNLKDPIYNSRTLVLGSSLPKTGIMNSWGSAVYAGANSYFSYVNDNHILKGRSIKLITYDDKYEPELTHENINRLIKTHDIFSLFGFVGTPTVKNILPIVEKGNIPFIAPFTGASFLREMNNKNFVNFRSSYQEEISTLVKYLKEKNSIDKFAVFYQNDNYGEEGYIALINTLKKEKLDLVAEGTYKRNTLSIRHAFNEIKIAKPQAVIMIGAYKANALFIKKAKEHPNFVDTIFCNISFGDANEMIKELNFQTKNLIFSQVVPSYNDYSKDVIKEYRNLMKKYYPEKALGFVSLESFLAAKTMVKALQNVKGALTRSKFLEELKKLPADTLEGLNLQFSNTQLLNRIYLFEYKDSKFRELSYDH